MSDATSDPSSDASLEGAMLLPVGTVTFLLSDIEGSTRLWQEAPEEMAAAVARHYELLDEIVAQHGGVRPEEQGEGDSIVAAFSRASDAVAAALSAQRALQSEPWPTPRPLRVRMAIHTGEARMRDGSNYLGMAIIRTARLRSLAAGAQVLVSSASRDLALDQLGDAIVLRDLGEHRLKDLARPERVYQLEHRDIECDFVPLHSLDTTPNNLPVRLSTFVGRKHELIALDNLLLGHRLVTVTGSGGAGKTRLALQLAANAVDRFPDGVWWIELAPLTDPAAVTLTVAEVVSARLSGSHDHADTIAARIAADRALLVIDNCEHLLDPVAALVETLVQRCPNLVVLATSRSPLDVPGEVTWRVPPLALPEPGVRIAIQQLSQFDSVELFAHRAREARSTFTLSDDNAACVAEICHRLDGIPLAIELAAARAKTMTPARILNGLSDALHLLTGGSRRVMPRQQTLDASVQWSCQLLGEQERMLMWRLSVFSGSFDLLAAESVCSGSGVELMAILDALERLVDGSLVVPLEGANDGRFSVLETVRQFGARQLTSAGELNDWHERHSEHYERVVHDLSPACETDRQFPAIATISADYDNIRASLGWILGKGDGERLAEMVLSLGSFWDVSGGRTEAAHWCARALDSIASTDSATHGPSVEPSVVQARLLALSAESRMQIGEFTQGFTDASAALAMGNELGDAWAAGRGSATLTTILGVVDLDAWRVRLAETQRLHEEAGDMFSLTRLRTWSAVPLLRRGLTSEGSAALAVAGPKVRASGQPMLIASQQMWEGQAALSRGELALAEQLGRAALDPRALSGASRIAIAESTVVLARAFRFLDRLPASFHLDRAERVNRENDRLLSDIHLFLGVHELLHEDPSACRRIVDECHAAHPRRHPAALSTEGILAAHAAFALDDLEDARTRSVDVIRWANACGSVVSVARAEVLLGAIALHDHDPTEAERLARNAISSHVTYGNTLALCDALELLAAIATECDDRSEAATILGACAAQRSVMGTPRGFLLDLASATSAALREAMGDGPFDRAFTAGTGLAVSEVIAFIERTRGTRGRPSMGWASLTPTELAVAELIRTGLTNRDIAQQLIMGSETVKTHLSHIFTKLGISKRSQLATLATQQAHQRPET